MDKQKRDIIILLGNVVVLHRVKYPGYAPESGRTVARCTGCDWEDPGTMWGFQDHVAEIMYQLLKEEGVLK